MISPSRPTPPNVSPGGFAPCADERPSPARSRTATALVLLALFVACVSNGVAIMAFGVAQLRSFEKVHGAYSLPDEIRRDLRFRLDPSGTLVLRFMDIGLGQWRDASVFDLAPAVIDHEDRRGRAHYNSSQPGALTTRAAALRQQYGTGEHGYADASQRPRDHKRTVAIAQNFFVTDGEHHAADAPLLDIMESGDDEVGMMLARIRRVTRLTSVRAG